MQGLRLLVAKKTQDQNSPEIQSHFGAQCIAMRLSLLCKGALLYDEVSVEPQA